MESKNWPGYCKRQSVPKYHVLLTRNRCTTTTYLCNDGEGRSTGVKAMVGSLEYATNPDGTVVSPMAELKGQKQKLLQHKNETNFGRNATIVLAYIQMMLPLLKLKAE